MPRVGKKKRKLDQQTSGLNLHCASRNSLTQSDLHIYGIKHTFAQVIALF